MDIQIESMVLRYLLRDEEYCKTVIPYIETTFFQGEHRLVFESVCSFVDKYGKLPGQQELLVELDQDDRASADEVFEAAANLSERIFDGDLTLNEDWVYDKTEKWCQDSALREAITTSVTILEGKHKKLDKGAIPDMMTKALSVTFNASIGHDYVGDAESRWEARVLENAKIPWSVDVLNEVCKGGYERKTLNILMAATHVGKTLMMVSEAAHLFRKGKKVLYITGEVADHRIGDRIDANILKTSIEDLDQMSKDEFLRKISAAKKRWGGEIIVHEYPTGVANANHVRALLYDLKRKRDFVPDVIMVDYINIMASSRIKDEGNTYLKVKYAAEEFRSLAQEFNVAIISATQTTRAGADSSDVGMTDTAESWGLPQTADFMLAIMQPPDFKAAGKYFCKQLKNRYRDLGYKEKFAIGVDKKQMTIYEVTAEASSGYVQSDGTISGGSIDAAAKDFVYD